MSQDRDNIARELRQVNPEAIERDYELTKQAYGLPSWTYEGEEGDWEVYRKQQQALGPLGEELDEDFFVAYYLKGDTPETVISGQEYNQIVLNNTLEVITDNVLEGDPFAGTPLAFNEEKGKKRGRSLPVAVALTVFGLAAAEQTGVFGSENAIDGFYRWLGERPAWEQVGIGLGAAGTCLHLPKAGEKLGGELGKYLDRLRLRDLPNMAEDYDYGQPVMEGLIREEDDSLSGLNE